MNTTCAIVLAAGYGKRLRPLTDLVPKPLCPIGNSTPLDRALDRLHTMGLAGPADVASNAHHLADQIVSAVGDRAMVRVETQILGTAGAIGNLADWIAGRDVIVCNGDAYLYGPIPLAFRQPHPDRVRLLTIHDPDRPDFGTERFAGISYLPAEHTKRLRAEPSSLYEEIWRPEYLAGRLELVSFAGVFFDCGTHADYQAANRHADRHPGLEPDYYSEPYDVRQRVGDSDGDGDSEHQL